MLEVVNIQGPPFQEGTPGFNGAVAPNIDSDSTPMDFFYLFLINKCGICWFAKLTGITNSKKKKKIRLLSKLILR